MPRRCTICTHPERDAIDRALIAGLAFRHIAAQWGVSTGALQRHKADDLPAALARAKDAEDVAHGDDLLAQLRDLQATTLRLLTTAERAGKLTAAVLAVGQARQNIELLAELLNQLDRRPTLNLLIAPEWLAVRSVLLTALQPYPEARAAVAERLIALEAGDARD